MEIEPLNAEPVGEYHVRVTLPIGWLKALALRGLGKTASNEDKQWIDRYRAILFALLVGILIT